MDYGPFGFIEKFHPSWNMWVGGGVHFSFFNQPAAAEQNFSSFTSALLPLLDAEHQREAKAFADDFWKLAKETTSRMWCRKLGLATPDDDTRKLWESLFGRLVGVDYTIFFRELSEVACQELRGDAAMERLLPCFYTTPSAVERAGWIEWLGDYWRRLEAQGVVPATAGAEMKR